MASGEKVVTGGDLALSFWEKKLPNNVRGQTMQLQLTSKLSRPVMPLHNPQPRVLLFFFNKTHQHQPTGKNRLGIKLKSDLVLKNLKSDDVGCWLL